MYWTEVATFAWLGYKKTLKKKPWRISCECACAITSCTWHWKLTSPKQYTLEISWSQTKHWRGKKRRAEQKQNRVKNVYTACAAVAVWSSEQKMERKHRKISVEKKNHGQSMTLACINSSSHRSAIESPYQKRDSSIKQHCDGWYRSDDTFNQRGKMKTDTGEERPREFNGMEHLAATQWKNRYYICWHFVGHNFSFIGTWIYGNRFICVFVIQWYSQPNKTVDKVPLCAFWRPSPWKHWLNVKRFFTFRPSDSFGFFASIKTTRYLLCVGIRPGIAAI